ncbi:hypothetical protein LTR08_004134 [Meristemomyces frigidus]|nr:hypothetical protein LTR08_004134 [Meristemomyces frigidus]
MDRNSQRMEASLAWALPVDVVEFGAHLEAYVNLQPTLSMLRLCNRLGQGPDAAITRLPIELVDQIEASLLHDECQKTRPVWHTTYECYSLECEPIDHLDSYERQWLYHVIFPGQLADLVGNKGKPPLAQMSRAAIQIYMTAFPHRFAHVSPFAELTAAEDERLAEELRHNGWVEAMPDWWDRHDQWKEAWYELTGHPTAHGGSFFAKQKDFLSSTFGLQLWVSYDRKRNADQGVQRTMLAYLILPQSKLGLAEWTARRIDEDQENDQYTGVGWPEPTEVGFAAPLVLPATPSEQSLSRWPHALKTLGLQTSDAEIDEEHDAAEDTGPTLTFLVKYTEDV